MDSSNKSDESNSSESIVDQCTSICNDNNKENDNESIGCTKQKALNTENDGTDVSLSIPSTSSINSQDGINEVAQKDQDFDDGKSYTIIAKYGKERLVFDDLTGDTTIYEIKEMITEATRILPKRQKLVGLVAVVDGLKGVHDGLPLSQLKVKGSKGSSSSSSSASKNEETANGMEIITHQFILMGTPEEQIFIDPQDRDDLALEKVVVDDFDLEFNAGSEGWFNHVAVAENLKKFTEATPIHIMNPPRDGKPLLVLDLDHTLLDFSSKTLQQRRNDSDSNDPNATGPSTSSSYSAAAAAMKRPYMDEFLAECYVYYDLVVWSQTSWRWLETKLIELGMISNPNYKFCFVLDKTSMFTITSTRKLQPFGSKSSSVHYVKPLQIIWSKFPDRWSSRNTVHIDDLSRNFALNMSSGLKIKPYYRKRASSGRRDIELLGLYRYLILLAQASDLDFDKVDFNQWADVAAGRKKLQQKEEGKEK